MHLLPLSSCHVALITYPVTPEERISFINPKTNRKLTTFHYKVYDLVAKVRGSGR
jgi:hypothetical protein